MPDKDDQDINEMTSEFDSDINAFDRAVLIGAGALTIDATIADVNFIVESAMADSGYFDTLNIMLNDKYDEILDDEIASIERITKRTVNISDDTLTALTKQKAVDLQNFSEVNRNIQNKISNELYQFSQGTITQQQLRARIGNVTEQFKSWTNTWTDTVIMGFKQDASIKIAQDNGINKFRYRGPRDTKTRLFCREVLNGLFGRPIKTIDEWNRLNDVPSREGQPDPVSIFRGGFNCRHRLEPVIGG